MATPVMVVVVEERQAVFVLLGTDVESRAAERDHRVQRGILERWRRSDRSCEDQIQ